MTPGCPAIELLSEAVSLPCLFSGPVYVSVHVHPGHPCPKTALKREQQFLPQPCAFTPAFASEKVLGCAGNRAL